MNWWLASVAVLSNKFFFVQKMTCYVWNYHKVIVMFLEMFMKYLFPLHVICWHVEWLKFKKQVDTTYEIFCLAMLLRRVNLIQQQQSHFIIHFSYVNYWRMFSLDLGSKPVAEQQQFIANRLQLITGRSSRLCLFCRNTLRQLPLNITP